MNKSINPTNNLTINLIVASMLRPDEIWEQYNEQFTAVVNNSGRIFSFYDDKAFIEIITWMFKFIYEKIDGGDSHIFSAYMLALSNAMRLESTKDSRRAVAQLMAEVKDHV